MDYPELVNINQSNTSLICMFLWHMYSSQPRAGLGMGVSASDFNGGYIALCTEYFQVVQTQSSNCELYPDSRLTNHDDQHHYMKIYPAFGEPQALHWYNHSRFQAMNKAQ